MIRSNSTSVVKKAMAWLAVSFKYPPMTRATKKKLITIKAIIPHTTFLKRIQSQQNYYVHFLSSRNSRSHMQ